MSVLTRARSAAADKGHSSPTLCVAGEPVSVAAPMSGSRGLPVLAIHGGPGGFDLGPAHCHRPLGKPGQQPSRGRPRLHQSDRSPEGHDHEDEDGDTHEIEYHPFAEYLADREELCAVGQHRGWRADHQGKID